MESHRLYEVAQHVNELPLFFDFLGRWMNRGFWDSRRPDLRQVVNEASIRAVVFQRDLASKEDAEQFKRMVEAGVEFNRVSDAELARFREATAPVYEKYEADFGKELIDSLRE